MKPSQAYIVPFHLCMAEGAGKYCTREVLRTTPIMALNFLLHIAPVDIAGRYMSAKVALRLRETGYLDDCECWHSGIPAHFDFIIKYLDYQIAETNPRCLFSAHIHSQEVQVGRIRRRFDGTMSFFTDGSRLAGEVGGRVYCGELSINSGLLTLSISLIFSDL